MADASRQAVRGTVWVALAAILGVALTSAPAPVEGRLLRVEGEVARPGWYVGETVGEAVAEAGGAAPGLADGEIAEGDRIRIVGDWALVDTAPAPAISYPVAAPTDGRVHLNRATLSELERLPRVGPVLAARIREARPYTSVAELDRVKGVGPATLALLSPLVAP